MKSFFAGPDASDLSVTLSVSDDNIPDVDPSHLGEVW